MADLWDIYEAASAAPAAPQLQAHPAALPAPGAIPPREWLYGTRLVRRFVSVLAAPGGVGKSGFALGVAVAMASGRGFLGERVHHRSTAWVLNLEDPLEEMNRRLAAVMLLHKLSPDEIAGRLFLNSGRDRRLNLAELDAAGGIAFPDRDGMIGAATAIQAGLIVIDPFVKSHTLDENSNVQMDAAATAWAEIAHATGAAVLLVHHVRKGAPGGDVDAARGAKSLTDAARSASLLSAMTQAEAIALAVPERERWRHVRLDDAKSNMAPRGLHTAWFRVESVALGNGTDAYPTGDHVAALAPWQPPNPFGATDAAAINTCLDLVAAGSGEGFAWSAHRTGRPGDRWVGLLVSDQLGVPDDEAGRIVAAWIRSGLLVESTYRHPTQRKQRLGLRVDDAKRPAAQKPRTTEA